MKISRRKFIGVPSFHVMRRWHLTLEKPNPNFSHFTPFLGCFICMDVLSFSCIIPYRSKRTAFFVCDV